MLAIVGGRPRVLSLVEMIDHFVDFRRDVVRRRTEFELRKAEARAHILEGLKIALDHLDEVIALIRASRNPAEAREGLVATFGLSVIQAQAILDMQLQRLTGLERQKIEDELAEVLKTIERLRAILASDRLLMEIVVRELREVRELFADERRTDITDESGEFRIEDLIADEDMAITVTHTGYVKRTAVTSYRNQQRGGKGRIGMRFREEDFVDHLFIASTHAYLMVFSDRGRAYWLKVHTIPDVGPDGKGKAIANLVSMAEGEKIASLLAVRAWEDDKFVFMGTRKGVVKKTPLSAFQNPRAGGIIAMGVEDDDAVIAVQMTDGTGRNLRGDPRRDGHPVPGNRRPADGAHRLRGPRHQPPGGRQRGRHGGGAARRGRHGDDRLRERVRQTDRPRRIPRAISGRSGYYLDPHDQPERPGGRGGLRARRRRVDAHHADRESVADANQRYPGHRPGNTGRPADRDRIG